MSSGCLLIIPCLNLPYCQSIPQCKKCVKPFIFRKFNAHNALQQNGFVKDIYPCFLVNSLLGGIKPLTNNKDEMGGAGSSLAIHDADCIHRAIRASLANAPASCTAAALLRFPTALRSTAPYMQDHKSRRLSCFHTLLSRLDGF